VACGFHDEILDVVSCMLGAIGELRHVYDDRVDRFIEGYQGAERVRIARQLHELATLTECAVPKGQPEPEPYEEDEPSVSDVHAAEAPDDPVELARSMQGKRHGVPQ
jgi:hypothetical protein